MKRKEHECRITNPHRDINGIVCLYIDGLRQSGKRTVRNGSTGSGGNTTADSNTGKLLYQNSKVTEVMRDPAFGDYGHLIFPVDIVISEDLELKDVEDILPWYSEVNPKKTVEIVNYMKDRVTDGEQIFYDIYSEEEKEADPAKEDTGLFFFRGDPGAKTAIVNAGGGFMYVAAMHDSFPQALELAKTVTMPLR